MSDLSHLLWRAAFVAVPGAVGVWVVGLGLELARRPAAVFLASRLGQWKPVLLKHGLAAGLLVLSVIVTGIGLAVVVNRVLSDRDGAVHS
jgi:hypothetical protein